LRFCNIVSSVHSINAVFRALSFFVDGNIAAYSAASCSENAAHDIACLYFCIATFICVANFFSSGFVVFHILFATCSAVPAKIQVLPHAAWNASSHC
jgi:hypothetical protein